jgi:hypothetical protein
MRAYLIHLGLTQCDTMNINKAAVLAYVHDPRNYGYDSSFGPYMSDGSGRINWVHLRAIHRTIAMHLVDLREDEPFVLVFSLVPIVVLPERHPTWDGPRQRTRLRRNRRDMALLVFLHRPPRPYL